MVKLNFLHTSDQAMISNDGKLSIIGIFTEINVHSTPAVHPKFSIVTNIIGELGEYEQTIAIIPPNEDNPIASVTGNSEIINDTGNVFVANFINTMFRIEGKYWIKISVKKGSNSEVISNKNEHFILVKKPN